MKTSQTQQVSMEVMVGAFMFLILLALGIVTIVLSEENLFQDRYDHEVKFDSVQGLIEGDKVFAHGVEVGRVTALRLKGEGVEVSFRLRQEMFFREGYTIAVRPSSVLGGSYLDLDPGPSSGALWDTNKVLQGESLVDLMNGAAQLVQTLTGAVMKIDRLAGSLAEEDGSLGRMLLGREGLQDLEDSLDNIREVTTELKRGDGAPLRWLAGAQAYAQLTNSVSAMDQLLSKANSGTGTLARLMNDDTLYTGMTGAVAQIDQAVSKINNGTGTLARIINDGGLYNSLTNTVAGVNDGVSEIRAMVDDLRETSPVTSFTSILFGAF